MCDSPHSDEVLLHQVHWLNILEQQAILTCVLLLSLCVQVSQALLNQTQIGAE